jgi:hypothetical protein
MPNDDLGQFPSPTSVDPSISDQPAGVPAESSLPIQEPITNNLEPVTSTPAFEQTPDEIPSVPATPASFPETPTEPDIQPAPPQEPIPASPPPQEVLATVVPKGGSSFGSLITIVILLIAGVAIAAAVFLFSQSKQLKQQIQEITQTLEKQKTTITPTPTPTIFEFTTPTPTPDSTISATPTPTVFPTPVSTVSAETALPLFNASKALRVAINHQPNAQLILIKTENATTPRTASTKYFFRQDLTTKKYFYVMITGIADPEVVDKSIYVTPDNNIPSLNDLVLGNTLGIDLNEAVKIAYDLCTGGLCKNAVVKAQYIKSGDNVIWQLSFAPIDTTKDTQVLQLNAQTKAILFKSPGF